MKANTAVAGLLGLRCPPIAIGFFDQPPAGIPRWTGGPVPSGCTFWQKAMAGATFYTEPADHYNCAVGSYTHRIGLPAERAGELQQTIGFMVESRYLEMSEVPGIPTLPRTPAAVAYAPAHAAAFQADVVVVAAKPVQAMLIYEAALKAGAGQALSSVLGRPGCAVLPLTAASGMASLSFGCKGSRTFTGLPDDEIYVCVAGARWPAVVDKLAETLAANETMGAYYAAQKQRFL